MWYTEKPVCDTLKYHKPKKVHSRVISSDDQTENQSNQQLTPNEHKHISILLQSSLDQY